VWNGVAYLLMARSGEEPGGRSRQGDRDGTPENARRGAGKLGPEEYGMQPRKIFPAPAFAEER
jgi:hypothetical protein